MVMKEGMWYIKSRTNNKIKTCGGCANGFLKDTFHPPNDLCLVTLTERLLRGEKAPFGKTKKVAPITISQTNVFVARDLPPTN